MLPYGAPPYGAVPVVAAMPPCYGMPQMDGPVVMTPFNFPPLEWDQIFVPPGARPPRPPPPYGATIVPAAPPYPPLYAAGPPPSAGMREGQFPREQPAIPESLRDVVQLPDRRSVVIRPATRSYTDADAAGHGEDALTENADCGGAEGVEENDADGTATPPPAFAADPEAAASTVSDADALRDALVEVVRPYSGSTARIQDSLSLLRQTRLKLQLATAHGAVIIMPEAIDFGQLDPAPAAEGGGAATTVKRQVRIQNKGNRAVTVLAGVPPLVSNVLQYTVKLHDETARWMVVAIDGSWILPPNKTAVLDVIAYVAAASDAVSNWLA